MKRTPLRRKNPMRRRGKDIGGYRVLRRDVAARSNGRCELGTPACTSRGSECHHLLPRSQGGKDDLGNCVWTCAPCHRYAHDHPREAYDNGWLRHKPPSAENPCQGFS